MEFRCLHRYSECIQFQTTLQPYVDVVRDDIGNPVVSATDPTRYEVYQLENTSGTLLPSIGLIIEL
jgi:hypothetical protein